jgi:hypothetical protein
MKSCETCLFFVELSSSYYECIANRVKRIYDIRKDCKAWVENTPENADKWLAKHGFPQADASDFASDFASESDCIIVDLKSK